MGVEAVAIGLSIGIFLPPSLAMYSQTTTISRENLEPELQKTINNSVVYSNKGL